MKRTLKTAFVILVLFDFSYNVQQMARDWKWSQRCDDHDYTMLEIPLSGSLAGTHTGKEIKKMVRERMEKGYLTKRDRYEIEFEMSKRKLEAAL